MPISQPTRVCAEVARATAPKATQQAKPAT